jgi:excisionase family DNA binding protein
VPTTTVAEAARTLGLSRQTVRRLIKTGQLSGHRLTMATRSAYRIDSASLQTYIDTRNQTR